MCGTEATAIDHVKPIARGGSNWPANLRPACTPCNSRKGTAVITEADRSATTVLLPSEY